MDTDPAFVPVEVVEEVQRPWGFWATAGFSIVVIGAFVAIQTAVSVPFAVLAIADHPKMPVDELAKTLESNGLLLSLAIIATAPVCLGLTVLFARLRNQLSVGQYLALNRVSRGTLLTWLSLLVAFTICSDGLTYLLGRQIVPEKMIMAYETSL